LEYNFKTKPYDHQHQAWKDSWSAEYYALFMEMGTGKSKVAIDTIGALYTTEKINAALIVAPKGVYDNWVKGEIPAHLSDNVKRMIVRWTPSSAKKFQEEMKELVYESFEGLKIFVMNVEALSTPRGTKAAFAFLKNNPDNIMVVDESTTIKNRKATRTKNVMMLSDEAKYRRILTGSPVTKSPMDLFAQCTFLAERALGFNSYYAFQNRYAVVQKRKMGNRAFQEIVAYRRLDELNEKLEKFSNRILKEDCLDLPDKVYTKREVPLTDEQKKLYVQMKKLALAQLDNGELSTTASVLTQIMRLQQICCGHITDDDGNIVSVTSNRYKELVDICDELQGKAIIWATYTQDIQQIASALRDRFGPEAVATYYGATVQDDRQDIVSKFQDKDSELRFFVGQPKTGGYGITLTAANTVIYFSNSYDLEIRLQSEDRAHRISQSNKVTYVDLVAPDTIDEKILKALRSKIDLAGKVLGEEARDWLL
jgi:SNF2 family DNA or RNA helicase|tara:strand:- start:5073 stop:6518 length:1446 start_codon:yes stop_codon:yes gene_type:complete